MKLTPDELQRAAVNIVEALRRAGANEYDYICILARSLELLAREIGGVLPDELAEELLEHISATDFDDEPDDDDDDEDEPEDDQ